MQNWRILQWHLLPEQSENLMCVSPLLYINFFCTSHIWENSPLPSPSPPSSSLFTFTPVLRKVSIPFPSPLSPLLSTHTYSSLPEKTSRRLLIFHFSSTASVHPLYSSPSLLPSLPTQLTFHSLPSVCTHCIFHSCNLILLHRPSSNPITSTKELSTFSSPITHLYLFF